jgi:hypothetical protein
MCLVLCAVSFLPLHYQGYGLTCFPPFFLRNHMAMVEWAQWGQLWEQVLQVQH